MYQAKQATKQVQPELSCHNNLLQISPELRHYTDVCSNNKSLLIVSEHPFKLRISALS